MVKASEDILASTSVEALLQTVVDAARDLTGARRAVYEYGYEGTTWSGSASSGSGEAPVARVSSATHGGGVGACLALFGSSTTGRWTAAELHAHPQGRSMPKGPDPLKGLVGARLTGADGRFGLILASHRAGNGGFTAEDEARLAQLASLAALGLRHIEACARAEARARALHESEERFRVSLQNSPVTVSSQDLDLRYTWSHNPQLGYSVDQVIGRTDAELLPPRTTEQVTSMKRRALQTGLPVREEVAVVREGQALHYDITVTPVRGPSGEFTGVTNLVLDITKRKRVEAERERRAAELQAAVSSIADGLLVCDELGRIKHASKAAVRIFGMTPGMFDLPFEQRIAHQIVETPEGQPFALEQTPIYRALALGESVTGVVMGVRLGSQVTWLSAAAAPVHTADGRRIGAVVSFTDITEVRNAKLDLERLLADRAEFMATCSHELKTPLTVLLANIGLFEYMLDSLDEQRRTKFLGAMIRQAKKLDRLVTDLLDVSRIESGHLTILPVATPLHSLVGRVVTDFGTACEARRVTAPTPPECIAAVDQGRFEQMLMNLLTNAAKYSEEGTSITVAMDVCDGCVEVSVTDEGCGIPEEDIPKLFERYYRHPSTGSASGLGIGLYVTMELARLHGGTVAVKSTVGAGSTFTLRLPLLGREAEPQHMDCDSPTGTEQAISQCGLTDDAVRAQVC